METVRKDFFQFILFLSCEIVTASAEYRVMFLADAED